jgi:nucleoside-diphosphate-sugar epimerase
VRVLVTGGHGFLGSHLVERLLARGARVRCLYRRRGVPAALAGLDVEIAAGDVRDPAAVDAALAEVDAVFHLAALTRSLTRREILRTNAEGTRVLVDAAARRRLPGRFVLCSSQAAVGPARERRPLDETDPARPITWYGESKRLAERIVLARQDRLAVTVVRPGPVYGPRDRDFLAVFRAARRGLLPVIGSGPAAYQFTYVDDVVEGLLAAADAPAAVGRTYFVTHAEALSPEAFLEHVERAVGRRARRLPLPDSLLALLARVGELAAQLTGKPPLLNRQRLVEIGGRFYLSDPSALGRDAGWTPRVGAAEGTARTASWYRAHGLL